MQKSGVVKIISILVVLCVAFAVASPAQTLKTLLVFDPTNGGNPHGSLVQGTDGAFYGTNFNYHGSVFKITPGGHLTTLYTFCSQSNCTDGAHPAGALLLAPNGTFYGTTVYGGAYNGGTVFSITKTGKFTSLYSFCAQTGCPEGVGPESGLVLGTDGNFYGTTFYGGSGLSGTVFKINPAGTLSTLYSFCSQTNCADGANPAAGLVLGTDGNLYGTTFGYGFNGTVFKISIAGKVTTLYTFCSQINCSDGANPWAGLVQGTDGDFYGTTQYGGNLLFNSGTVFKITPAGALATLHTFCSETNCSDGAGPLAGLMQATDGNLYGAALPLTFPCTQDCGTVFRITPAGKLTTLHTFCSQANCPDGANPYAAPMQATDGNFYGVTFAGGNFSDWCATQGCGTVFGSSLGLGPFVEANPNFGRAGRTVNILGYKLSGTTAVTFNGTPATFAVVSDTYIKAAVPTGAATGTIQVTTPNGPLGSNVTFQVLP